MPHRKLDYALATRNGEKVFSARLTPLPVAARRWHGHNLSNVPAINNLVLFHRGQWTIKCDIETILLHILLISNNDVGNGRHLP